MADWKPKQFAHKKKKQTGKKTKPFVPADPITPQQAGQDAFRKNILGKFAFGTDILSPLGLDTQGPPQNLPERGISKETYESYGGDPSKGDDSWVAPAPNFLGQPNPVADLMPYSKEGLSAWWNETSDAIMHLGKAAKNLLDLGSQNTVQFAEQLTQGSINPAKFVFDRFNDLLTVTSAPFIVLDQVARVEPRLKTVSNVIRGVFEATSWLERSKFKAINRLADESGLTKFLADNGGLSVEKQQALRQSVDEFLAGAMPIVIGVGGAKIPWAKAFGKKPPPIEPTAFKEGVVPEAGDILTPPDNIGRPSRPPLGLPPGPPAPLSLPAPGETTGRIALPPSSLPQPPSGSELGKRVARDSETNKLELRLREDLLKTEREIQDPATFPKERVKLTKLAAEIRQQLKNLDDTGDPTKSLEETKPKTRKKSQAPKKIVTEKTDTEPGSIVPESSLPPNPKAPKNQGVKLRSEKPKETVVSKNNKKNALKVPDEEGKIPVEEKKVSAPEKPQNELDLPQENIEFIQNKVRELYDKGGIDEVNKVYDESSPVGRYGREYAKRYAQEKTPSPEVIEKVKEESSKLEPGEKAVLEQELGPDYEATLPSLVQVYLKNGIEAIAKYSKEVIDTVKRIARTIALGVALVISPVKSDMSYAKTIKTPTVIYQATSDKAPTPPQLKGNVRAEGIYKMHKEPKSFAILDKDNGKLHIFDKDKNPIGEVPAIFGADKSEQFNSSTQSRKTNATTPGGKYRVEQSTGQVNLAEEILYGDQEISVYNALGVHPTYEGELEQRNRAYATQTPEDNRVSWGCVNVDKAIYKSLIEPYMDNGSYLYVIPYIDAEVGAYKKSRAALDSTINQSTSEPSGFQNVAVAERQIDKAFASIKSARADATEQGPKTKSSEPYIRPDEIAPGEAMLQDTLSPLRQSAPANLSVRYEAAKQRLAEKTKGRLNALPLDTIPELLEIGAYWIHKGARTFGEWAMRVTKEIGATSGKLLRQAWDELTKDRTNLENIIANGIYIPKKAKRDTKNVTPFKISGDKHDIMKHPKIGETFDKIKKRGGVVYDAFGGSGRIAQELHQRGMNTVVNFLPFKKNLIDKFGSKPFVKSVKQLTELLEAEKDPRNQVKILREYPDKDAATLVANNVNKYRKEVETPESLTAFDMDVTASKLEQVRTIASKPYPIESTAKDGWDVLREAKPGDAVILDPPYTSIKNDYARNGGLTPEHLQAIKEAVDRGVNIVYFDKFSPVLAKQLRKIGLSTNAIQRVASKFRELFAYKIAPYIKGEKSLKEPGTLGLFGGNLGKSFKAKERQGVLIDHPTEPGKKVYEIDDSNMKFKKRGEEFIQRFVHDVNKKSTPSKLTNMKLGDFVDWPELFQEYPHAKNIKTEWTHYPEGKESLSGGLYNYKTKTIELYSTEGEVGLRDALKNRIIHEVQHELSGKEGWDAGGSTPRVLWHMENFIQREKSLIDSLTHNNPEKRFKQYQLAAKRFLNKFNPPGAVLNDGLVKALFAKSEPDILVLYPLADNAYNGLRGEKLSRIAESRRELTASEREQLPPSENKHASYPDSGETLQRYMNADITGKISIPNAVNESRAPGPPPPPPRPVKAKREFPKPESGFNTWQRLVFETVNFWEPLSRRARETGVRDKVGDPSLEMAMLNNRNYFAGNWIKGKVGLSLQADGLNFKAHSNTIRNYLRLVRGKEQEFADYLMARRIVGDHEYLALSKKNLLDATKEYHRKNVDFATTPKGDPNYARIKREYDDAVKQLKHWKEEVAETQRLIERDNFDLKEAKAKELAGRNAFAKPTAMYDKINERMLEWSHYSGRLPKELFDEWKANKNYASFKRWIEHHQIVTSTDLKRNPSQKDFSAREGSTRGLEVIDPVFSQAQMITETISKSLENMMWNRLDTLADSNAALRAVFYPDPDGPIVFMKNGKKVRYAAPLDIIEMAKTMSPGKIGEAAEFALWAARTFVRGTTSANPFWGMSVNFVIDQLSAMMNSKYGFVPIWTPLRHALPNMIKNRTLWQIFKAMGGEKSTLKGMLGDDPATFGNEVLKEAFTPTDWSSAREIFRKDYWKGDKPSDVGRKAVELSLNALELPTNITEMMTRFAEFKKAIDEGASHTEAMYHAMNVSVPFHMRGRLGGAYSLLRTIAYLGANIQAFYRYAKTTRDAPYKVTAITAGSILATMGAMHHFQNASDQQKRMLGNKTIEDLTKAIFLPHPDGKTLIRIRIPDVLGAFTAFPALWAIGNMLGGKKAETREYAKALMQLLPIPFQWYDPTKGFTLKPALNMLPQVIKPTLEVATNTRSYPEVMPIVPEYLQDVKPQYQYTDYTSGFAKFMGELTGSSPMLIDHWVRAQFGSMAGYILKPQNLASSNSLWQDEGVWAMSGRTYNGFYEIKDMALKDYKESRDSKKKSFEENRQVVARNVITERVGKIVSDLRKIQRANPDALTEPMKEQAYELMVNINNDPNLENRLLEVESLSKNVMKVIKELELTPSHTPFYANEYPLYVKNKLEKLHPEREKEIEQFTKKAKEIRKTREKEKKQTTKEEQEEQDDD